MKRIILSIVCDAAGLVCGPRSWVGVAEAPQSNQIWHDLEETTKEVK